MAQCGNCSGEVTPGELFCGSCGQALVWPDAVDVATPNTPTMACTNCSAPMAPTETFCGSCGLAVGQQVQSAVHTPWAGSELPPPTLPPPSAVQIEVGQQVSSDSVGAPDKEVKPRSRKPLIAAVSFLVVGIALVVAVVLGGGDDKEDVALAPDTSLATDESSKSDTTETPEPEVTDTSSPSESTAGETIPVITLPATTTTEAPSISAFPTSAPTCDLVFIDPQVDPYNNWSACYGPFAVTGPYSWAGANYVIYRWTGEKWQNRGTYDGYCTSGLTPSGLPNEDAKLIAFPGIENNECYSISLHREPSSGPLSFNDEGERVRELQRRLIELGLLSDAPDSQFGPNTMAAVYDLQFLTGLPPTGIAGPDEFELLGL